MKTNNLKLLKHIVTTLLFLVLAIQFYSGGVGAGNCLQFDGSNDYVEVPHSTSLDITGAITISAWINGTLTGNSTIVAKADYNGMESTTSYVLLVGSFGNTRVITFVLYGSYPADFFSTTETISANKWTHIAATWDGTTTNANNVKIYINGILSKSFTKTSTLRSTTQSITFGTMKPSFYGNPLNGTLDEITIWNKELSPSEIRQTMCQNLKGNESGLMGYWRFDEGSGNTVYDASGNGNNGTLY